MELHSYAKRKAVKKWTIEQKRKLVETRIAQDSIFAKKPLHSLATWKKIVALAKLEDFNVTFVRKQWANMVVKYKQYKRSRLGSTATNTVDDELLRKAGEEWEFFHPIHEFMSRKLTNLHSYALTEGQKLKQSTSNVLTQQQQQEQNENNASLASQLEEMLASHDNDLSPKIEPGQNIATFCSDTNEDYAAEITASEVIKGVTLSPQPPVEQVAFVSAQHDTDEDVKSDDDGLLSLQQAQNTDHDFYSKKSPKHENEGNTTNNSAASKTAHDHDAVCTVGTKTKASTKTKFKSKRRKTDDYDNDYKDDTVDYDGAKVQNNNKPCCSRNCKDADTHANGNAPSNRSKSHKKPKLSERDKYYRHKRRFNRRIETRFDKLLNVFGQIVKAEYPSINVTPLLGTAAANIGSTNGTGLKFPDFDDEDYLNGYHRQDALLSSDSAASTEDFDMNISTNDGDEVDNDDENEEVAAESQKNKTAAG